MLSAEVLHIQSPPNRRGDAQWVVWGYQIFPSLGDRHRIRNLSPHMHTDTPAPHTPLRCPRNTMVVRVGGSFAYLAGDGMLTFDDHVRTVGDLRSAIERTTKIPGKKQVRVRVLRPLR